jgi:hypothetical protein
VDDREDTDKADRTPSGACILSPNTYCVDACKAYSKDYFLDCYFMETMRSMKMAADKVSQTSDQIVQQIESSWHPR